MYTGYLFITAFAILVANAVSDDSISVNVDRNQMSMPTDDLCKMAGYEKVRKETTKTVKVASETTKSASTGSASSMSTMAIILTVLGVFLTILIAGLVALYLHGKAKVN